jgi:two-component system, response regulator
MKKSILLVEDNASDEKLTVLALKKCPIENQIAVVRDGAEALDYLFASGPHSARDPAALPALVLLDLNLPKIDGLSVLRRIRANDKTRTLPVVVLTSSKQDEDIAQGFASGANAYVRKPVDYAEFVEAAKAIGVFWLSLNETVPSAIGG